VIFGSFAIGLFLTERVHLVNDKHEGIRIAQRKKVFLTMALILLVTIVLIWQGYGAPSLIVVILDNLLLIQLANKQRTVTAIFVVLMVLVLPAAHLLAPRWKISEQNGRTTTCDQILAPSANISARVILAPNLARINADQALTSALITSASNSRTLDLWNIDGPILVDTTFPDGIERLAWYTLITSLPDPTAGTSDAVYIDAQTGQPLMFLTDIENLSDVKFECGRSISLFTGSLVKAGLIVLGIKSSIVGYWFILGLIITGLLFYFRWKGKPRHKPLNIPMDEWKT